MKNAAQKSKKTKPATKNNRGRRASLQMESLEIRDLLVGNALDFVDNLAVTSGQPPAIMTLDFDPSSDSAIFGLRIEGKSGNLDPSTPFMYQKDSPSNHITPLQTIENVGGTTDSLIIFEAGPADLTIEVSGTGSGDFQASLFVVGDSDGDGVVSETEKMTMVAAELQGRGAGNFNTAEYFKAIYGIDFNDDQYDAYGDANGNGKIDAYELGYITQNSENSTINVDLIGDNSPPAISATITNDTGRFSLDNISMPPATNTEAAISGTITDFSKITGAVLSIDGTSGTTINLLDSPSIQSLTVTDSVINFSLSIDDLNTLLGGSSVVDSGSHTLNFIGLDEIGNETTDPGQVFSFTFDSTAPSQPAVPVMDSSDDTGTFNDDAITQNGGPLFISSGHSADSSVEFFNDNKSFGSVLTDSNGFAKLELTPGFANGEGAITVIETDLAGNVSSESDPLDFRIDSIDPATVGIDLDNNLATFDHLTEETTADFEGTIAAGTYETDFLISLQNGSGVELASTTSSSGTFSFLNVALNEGHNDFQFVATDLAGNTSTLEFDVTRNLEPEIDVPAPGVLNFNETTADAISTSIGTLILDPLTEDTTENLTYEILSFTARDSGGSPVGLTDVVFAINNAGELSLVADPNQGLNSEAPGSITQIDFEIKVTDDLGDGNGGDLSDTVTVTVALNDIDDRPEVTGTPGPFSVDELDDSGTNIANGADIADAQMDQFFTDADASQDLEYSIFAGDAQGAFSIDPDNGQIKIGDINELNFETTPSYTLTIKATDTNSTDPTTESETVDIVINLGDINEAPVATGDPFTLTPTFGELIGNSIEIPGQSVIAAGFADPDNADMLNEQTLTYTTNDDRFVFVGSTLQTAADLTATTLDFNFEDPANFDLPNHGISFEVTANDGNGGMTVAVVNVQVTNENDVPIFDSGSYSLNSIAEDSSTGASLGTVIANDEDSMPSDTLTYSVTNDARFEFDGSELKLAANADIDFEVIANRSISLDIEVNDGQGGIDTDTITVMITGVNEGPVIEQTSYQVPELQTATPGAVIGSILFTDPEVDDNTQMDSVVFSEVNGGPSGESLDFNVTADGKITVQSASQIAPGKYSIDVEGIDQNGTGMDKISTGVITLEIEVLDNLPPELLANSKSFDVNENTAGDSNNPVFTIEASDDHPGPNNDNENNEPFTFAIVGGASDKFVLVDIGEDTKTGVAIKDGAILNHEANDELTLTIRTTDSIGSFKDEIVTFNIIDLNEAPEFTAPGTNPAVNEFIIHGPGESDASLMNPVSGVTVIDLDSVFSDVDDGDNLIYSITATDLAGGFKVVGNNLVIDDAALINADGQSQVQITIEADDQQGEANSKTSDTITIDLNQRNELPDLNALNNVGGPFHTYEAYIQDVDEASEVATPVILGNIFTDLGLANDPEGNNLTIVDKSTGDAANFFTIAANGDVTVDSAVSITGLSEDFILDFSISDDNGSPLNSTTDLGYSDFQAKVTITENKAPEFDSVDNFSIDENTVVFAFDVDATDPEGNDPITFGLNDASGIFEIDPNSGVISVKDNTNLDFEATPPTSIEVTATDSLGNTSMQTITVTVNDVNEAPTTNTDPFAFSFDEDIASETDIHDFSANFSDPDNEDGLDLQTLTFTSSDDRFVFDGSKLQTKENVTSADFDFDTIGDTISFMVTATDGNLSTSATVNVTLVNVDEAPEVVGGLNDMLIPESTINNGLADEDGNLTDDEFKITFDASNFLPAFEDPDAGDQIQLEVHSSSTINPSVIKTISFDSSNNLVVEFHHYGSKQDRSLSDIVVFAKDDVGSSGTVSFDLGITPQKTIDIQMRNVFTPTSLNDSTDGLALGDLPENQVTIGQGATFYTELWVTDLLGSGQVSPGRAFSAGLHSIDVDFTYDSTQVSAVNATITDPFLFNTGAPINPIIANPGEVTQMVAAIGLNNAEDSSGNLVTATNGEYVRIGFVEFIADGMTGTDSPFGAATPTPDFIFELLPQDGIRIPTAGTGSALLDNTLSFDSSQYQVNNQGIDVVQASEFIIDMGETSITTTGTWGTAPLTAQSPGSDTTTATGSIFVRLDNVVNPTQIQIVGGDFALLNTAGSFAPGDPISAGGTPTDAAEPANFGLTFVTDIEFPGGPTPIPFNITVRDTEVAIMQSDPMSLSSGMFDTSDLNYNILKETINFKDDSAFVNEAASLDVRDEALVSDGSTVNDSMLVGSGSNFTLTLNLAHTTQFQIEGETTTLNIIGQVVAKLGDGAQLQGSVTAENGLPLAEGTGLFTTVAKQKTAVDANAQVAVLPKSESWVNEWDSYWVEVWGNTAVGPGISGAAFDLSYNTDYFSATEFEYSSAFSGNGNVVIDDAAGTVTGISGSTEQDNVGGSQFVLIGRVRFESLADDHVDMGIDGAEFGPKSLGIEINSAAVDVVNFGRVLSGTSEQPDTEVWAVPYDINDDDKIGLADLSNLVNRFGGSSFSTDSDALTAALDFDNSGSVGLADLSQLVNNFGLGKGDGHRLIFPGTFTQMWIGQEVDTTGPNTVEEVFETALQDWQTALGLDEVLDVRLVVKDFDNGQLGEAQLTGVDEAGLPSQGILTLDDDANGVGWSADLAAGPSAGLYDLYTVILHELGHLHGFMNQYAGFQNVVAQDGSGNNVIITADGSTAELDYYAQHLDTSAHAGDLLNDTLDPGVRKEISALDVQLIQAAYAAADGGSSDTATAALHATGTLPTVNSSNVEIDFALSNVVDITEVSGSTGVAVVMPESTRKELSNNGIKVVTSSLNSEEVTGDVNQIFADFEYRADNSDLELVAEEIETLVTVGDASTEADDLFADWDEFDIN